MQCKVRSKEGKKERMKRDGMMEIWKYGTKTQKQETKKRSNIKTKNKNAQRVK